MVPARIVVLPAAAADAQWQGRPRRSAAPSRRGRGSRRGGAGPALRPRSCWPAIWAELLGVAGGSRVAPRHFFHLGGHSLLAAQVVSRVRRLSGWRSRRRASSRSPTLAGLARGGRRRAPDGGRRAAGSAARAGAARGPPAALPRAGAPLVPRPAGARQLRLQHPRRGAAARCARPAGARRGPRRDRGAPRGPADLLRGGGGPPGAGDPVGVGDGSGAAGRRSRRPRPDGAGGGASASRDGRGGAALRPCGRPSAAGAAGAPGAAGGRDG